MTRSKRSKTSASEDVVDGVAYEKSSPDNAGDEAPDRSAGTREDQATPAPDANTGRSATGMTRFGPVIAMCAMLVAGGALGVSGYLYYHMAGAAKARDSANDASRMATLASIEEMTTRLAGADESLRDLTGRLATAEAALAAQKAETGKLEQRLITRLDQDNDARQGEVEAIRKRLAINEEQLVDIISGVVQSSPARGDAQAEDEASAKMQAPQANTDMVKLLPAGITPDEQLAAVLVMALLADDAAGRPLDRWLPALSVYDERLDQQEKAGASALVRQVITEIKAAPTSNSALLDEADGLVAVMAMAVNEAGEDAGFFERTISGMAKMVRLRSVSADGDDARGQLTRFEAAVNNRDLGAAADIAVIWKGPQIAGLESWQAQARSRMRLDLALADLVTIVLAGLTIEETDDTASAKAQN